jgi:hypothetical protein
MRSTPVSVLHVDGRRYVVTGFDTHWVKNARKVGWGTLRRGWKIEKVAMVERPVEERGPIMSEFPRQVPHGVEYDDGMLKLHCPSPVSRPLAPTILMSLLLKV